MLAAHAKHTNVTLDYTLQAGDENCMEKRILWKKDTTYAE